MSRNGVNPAEQAVTDQHSDRPFVIIWGGCVNWLALHLTLPHKTKECWHRSQPNLCQDRWQSNWGQSFATGDLSAQSVRRCLPVANDFSRIPPEALQQSGQRDRTLTLRQRKPNQPRSSPEMLLLRLSRSFSLESGSNSESDNKLDFFRW